MNIELLSTKALMNELMRRSDVGVIVMMQNQTESNERFVFAHRGSAIEVLGLAEVVKQRVHDSYAEHLTVRENSVSPIERSEDEDEEEYDGDHFIDEDDIEFIDDPTELSDDDEYNRAEDMNP